MPVAPPASEVRFHRRTSSGSVIRPSSRGRPGTWGCIHSGPACASACQNSLRGPGSCPGPGAHQVDGVPLLPRLAALARGHPGKAPPLHLRGRAPLVAGPRRHVGQAGGDPVGHDGVVGIGAPDGLHAPAQEAVGVVDAEAQPVQHVRVRPRRPRGVHVLPLGDGVALPGPADGARQVRTAGSASPGSGPPWPGSSSRCGRCCTRSTRRTPRWPDGRGSGWPARSGIAPPGSGRPGGQGTGRGNRRWRSCRSSGCAPGARWRPRSERGRSAARPTPGRPSASRRSPWPCHSRPPGQAGRRSRPSRAPRARPRWPTTGTSAGRRSSRPPRPWRSRAPSPRGAGCSCGSRRRRRGCAGGGPTAGSLPGLYGLSNSVARRSASARASLGVFWPVYAATSSSAMALAPSVYPP